MTGLIKKSGDGYSMNEMPVNADSYENCCRAMDLWADDGIEAVHFEGVVIDGMVYIIGLAFL